MASCQLGCVCKCGRWNVPANKTCWRMAIVTVTMTITHSDGWKRHRLRHCRREMRRKWTLHEMAAAAAESGQFSLDFFSVLQSRQRVMVRPEETLTREWPSITTLTQANLEKSPAQFPEEKNKMLSYRKETALQGVLVLAKSGRLELREYFTDIIGLSSVI